MSRQRCCQSAHGHLCQAGCSHVESQRSCQSASAILMIRWLISFIQWYLPIDWADLTLVGPLVSDPDLPDDQGPLVPHMGDLEPGVRDEDLLINSKDVPVPPPDPGHRSVGHQLHPTLQECCSSSLRKGKLNICITFCYNTSTYIYTIKVCNCSNSIVAFCKTSWYGYGCYASKYQD